MLGASHRENDLCQLCTRHTEKPKNCVITEDCEFSPGLVDGDYAKSKAAATEMVFSAARKGLNVSIVFPSGIIGPSDVLGGLYINGKILSHR